MRKVLAITAALMIAAMVIMPALGYTNQAAGNQSYSIKSGDRITYSLTTGIPAHNLTANMIVNKFSFKSAGIKSIRMPYSFKEESAPGYSLKVIGVDSATPLGMATKKETALLGSIKEQQTAKSEALPEPVVEPAAEVVPVAPVINETEVAPVAPVINETEVAPVAPVINETEVAPVAPVANETEAAVPAEAAGPRYLIMGMVTDDSQAALEGWQLDLSKDGAVIDSATSGKDGKFSFINLPAGVYTVSEILEDGWSAVSPENGTKEIAVESASVIDLVFVNKKA